MSEQHAIVLRVRGLSVAYLGADAPVRAVEGMSLDVHRGEIIGLVGESGSGKSTAVLGMFRLLPPPAVITAGEVHFQGQDVLAMDEEALRQLRWRDVSLVPQSALNALNPVLTVGAQFADTIQAHGPASNSEARARAAELLQLVELDPQHLDSYPHELSGGMRQRVAVALALALRPPLILMDEPTTALDVVVEREILSRVMQLQREQGFAILFITHDLSLLTEIATRIGVMYSGRLVELAPVDRVAAGGRHPYTQGLLRAMPRARGDGPPPESIPGSPPRLTDPPPGCRFHPRCRLATARCHSEEPVLREIGPGHSVACHEVIA